MESQRFQQAIGRLEAAVERVERATPTRAGVPDDDRLAAMEARHRRLCDSAGNAIARLDRLIDGRSGVPD